MKIFYLSIVCILLFGCEFSFNREIKNPFLSKLIQESGHFFDDSEINIFQKSNDDNIEVVIDGLEEVQISEFYKTLRYISRRLFDNEDYGYLEVKYTLKGDSRIQIDNVILEKFEVVFNKGEFQEEIFTGELLNLFDANIKEALNECGSRYVSFDEYEYYYFEYGFSLCPINDVIKSIFYYSGNTKEGFNKFNGILPYELKFGMNKSKIIDKFDLDFIEKKEPNMLIYKGLFAHNFAFTFNRNNQLIKVGLFV